MTTTDDADAIRHRLSVVEALLQAVDRRAELVETIFHSPDFASARQTLMQPPWSFAEAVVPHVLDMPLRRMTAELRVGLAADATELRAMLGDS